MFKNMGGICPVKKMLRNFVVREVQPLFKELGGRLAPKPSVLLMAFFKYNVSVLYAYNFIKFNVSVVSVFG